MPNIERVQEFVALVEGGETVRALEDFYLEQASQQENFEPLRSGKRHLVLHEKKMLKAFSELKIQVKSILIDGDRVVLNYFFRGTTRDGRIIEQDELAFQRWEGEFIAEERFYYDPGQRSAPAAKSL